jgi:hypothetical protein
MNPMNSCRVAWISLTSNLVALAAIAMSGELPKDALVLDPQCIYYSWPYPTISPDGKWVAYVSRGHICVCSTTEPGPHKIMEVAHSWTWPHLVAKKGDSQQTGSFGEFRGLGRDEYRELHKQVTNTIYGLSWAYDSSGFVFSVQAYDAANKKTSSDVYFASVVGKLTKLVHCDSDALTRTIVIGSLTRDRQFLVGQSYQMVHPEYRPLIWDVKNEKPRATCFLYLTPSKTSDQWIGIEKDTRQLVIADAQFQVIKRFNEYVPDKTYGFQLDWSPDERFILWRNQIGFDHYNNWEGFHMDLDTGSKRLLEGQFMDELFQFTGRGGEFIRTGQDGVPSKMITGNTVTGAHLTIVPEGNGRPQDLWRITVGPKGSRPGMLTNRPGNPPVHMSQDSELFAIGLPRPAGERSGCFWHLMNRQGKAWRLPGKDNQEYVSPYELAGFADNDRLIVAYDTSRLFTIPVSNVLEGANLPVRKEP